MPIQTTYSNARETLADLWREVEENGEIIIINRRGHEDVALISAAELSSVLETAHLLRSPANARRLLTALQRALDGRTAPATVEGLRREYGLEPAAE
ncbi:MAG: type II toxin-antitoxin system prevent-host-death family antitoxin [Gemmatimonadetes bacterium]|nr:type II toxin-antitoxin system prevent-host-death family antitoxin [Gemmatimonadota bacterium]MBK6779778.1 type II toxin-antitoxin system prevent-host-death family antitoxin [Gemmatimonadota bacterium]MBK7350516.1 type II toxin-antitoxin system prevent-host-death family antitoxin [Gemmatimonadota bacterium]MBK7717181.1 type II toxin-antitoxin system prevent-host-death family antitoxin [Gemmatimonadota bacterium]MBK7785662.1 type II toxin-antitoxin system prevent-host-death family antitoxin [